MPAESKDSQIKKRRKVRNIITVYWTTRFTYLSFGDLPLWAKRGDQWKLILHSWWKKHVGISFWMNLYKSREGVRFTIIKYSVTDKIPWEISNKAKKTCLYFKFPGGKALELIDDCICLGVDKLMASHGGLIWQEDEYQKPQEYVRAELMMLYEIVNVDVLTQAFTSISCLKAVDISVGFRIIRWLKPASQLVFRRLPHGETSADISLFECNWETNGKISYWLNRDRAQMSRMKCYPTVATGQGKLTEKQKTARRSAQNIRWMIEDGVSLFTDRTHIHHR